MLWLTRWFGVTATDSDRDLAREKSDIEEIISKTLQVQATSAAEQHRPLARGTHAKGVCARDQFEYSTLKPDALPSWGRGSPRGCSLRLAYIPRSCGGGMLIRRRTLISSPTFDPCRSRSTSLGMALLFRVRTRGGRIFHCKIPLPCRSTTPLHLRRS